MYTQKDYDIVVIGGGPAGATAAYLLSLQGLRVLVIDKCNFPRNKLCGGLITQKTIELLHRVYGDTLETLKKKKIVNYISNSYEIKINDSTLVSDDINLTFAFVDRMSYDNYLLENAKNIGVKVIEGDRVIKVNPSDNTIHTSSGRVLQAKVIVGADGVNSVVRKALPYSKYNPIQWKRNLGTALEVFIPRSNIEGAFLHPVIYFGLVNWGYAWVFPNKERIVVGIGALARHNKSMKKVLEDFIYQIGYDKNILPKFYGHLVPYGNFLSSPVFDQILLIGDSAGLVDPFTGEGIYYAQRSAELASLCVKEAMRNGKPLEITYPQSLREQILPELSFINKGRPLIFGMASNLHFLPLKCLLRILGPRRQLELVQGVRSYQWFRKRSEKDEKPLP